MELTFDQAIELLEITDISKVKVTDIPAIEKKLQKRWHPDRVAHLNNPALTEEYTIKFQQIEWACQMIISYLEGTYHAGEGFTQARADTYREPEEIIRENAPEMQQTLRSLWTMIKERKYKWSEEEVVLSDGYKLKDLLREDFKEDISILSVVSFFYGLVFLSILAVIGNAIHPAIGAVVAVIWMLQALSCFLGFAPLSRFWLPASVSAIMIKFINFGLGIYHWAEERGQNSNGWVILLIRIPVLFAKLVKYLILLPLTELAKAFVGNKVVGVVKQKVNYYAGAAEWYVEQLVNADPAEMTYEELSHLSQLHSELYDVKAKTNENDGKATFTEASSPGNSAKDQFNKNTNTKKTEPPKPEQTFTTEKQPQPEETFTNKTETYTATPDISNNGKPPVEEKTVPGTNDDPDTKKKRKRTVTWAIVILLLAVSGLAGFFLIGKSKNNDPVTGKKTNMDSVAITTEEDKMLLPVNYIDSSVKIDQPASPVVETIKEPDPVVTPSPAIKKEDAPAKNDITTQSGVTVPETGSFVFLNKNQVKNDLLNKRLCEGIIYTGEDQSLTIINMFPSANYQRSVDLYETIRILLVLKDDQLDKSCKIEVIYKKDKNRFELENYAQK